MSNVEAHCNILTIRLVCAVPHGARGDDDFQRVDGAGGAIRLRDRRARTQITGGEWF